MLPCLFRFGPTGKLDLGAGGLDGVVGALCIGLDHIFQTVAPHEPVRLGIYDQPGAGAGRLLLPGFVFHAEIPQEEQAFQPLVPGDQADFVPPEGHIGEADVHAGKDPGRAVGLQVVESKAQFAGGPVGQFLRQVHERGRFQVERSIRVVARDDRFLIVFIIFCITIFHIRYKYTKIYGEGQFFKKRERYTSLHEVKETNDRIYSLHSDRFLLPL